MSPYLNRTRVLLAAVTLLLINLTGCVATYKPPFVPINVSVSTEGELLVRYDGEFVTPYGQISVDEIPDTSDHEDDLLLVISISEGDTQVSYAFWLEDFKKSKTSLVTEESSDIKITQSDEKATIELSPGNQEFTLQPEDKDKVDLQPTTSATQWSESSPSSSTPPTSPSEPSITTSPPKSGPETTATDEVVPTTP